MGMVGKDLRLRYIMRRFGLVGWCWDWVCLGFREACGMLLETGHELHEIERQLRSTSTAIHWAF
jgi:hypothetical protein